MRSNLVVLVIALLIGAPCYANPIILNISHDGLWYLGLTGGMPVWIAIVSSAVALALEFALVEALVTRPEKRITRFGRKFVGIHCLTFPATQFLALFFGPVTEIFPIVVEKLFYNRSESFRAWGYKGWFVVVLGNIVSWLTGFIFSEIYWRNAAA